MGKWSTYRKRGTPAAPLLLPPPGPQALYIQAGILWGTDDGLDNTGGTVELYASSYEEGPYAFWGTQPWDKPSEWGEVGEWQTMWVKTRTLGNDINYAGWSPLSDFLYVPE